ncbi:unnamed protein product, partial [Ectocarpus fasciculatus]
QEDFYEGKVVPRAVEGHELIGKAVTAGVRKAVTAGGPVEGDRGDVPAMQDGAIGEMMAVENAESLDELSSLDKQYGPRGEESSGTQFEEAGKSYTEGFNRGAVSAEVDRNSTIHNYQLGQEESMDELSSVDQQREPYQDGSVGGVPAGRQKSFIKEYFNGGARTVEDAAPGGNGINGQLGQEESLDELSSVDKQGESYQDESIGGVPAGKQESFINEYVNGGEGTAGNTASGGIGNNYQLGNEESMDELSSLDKHGEGFESLDELSSLDKQLDQHVNFDGGARRIEDAAPGSIGSNSSQLGNEESLDELLSLDKQSYQDGSVDGMRAEGEPPTDGYINGGARRMEDVAPGGIGDRSQLGKEESMDELSSLDKQPYQDGSVDGMPVGGEPSTDGYINGGARRMEDAAPGGIGDRSQLGKEESLDELSSLDKRSEERRVG